MRFSILNRVIILFTILNIHFSYNYSLPLYKNNLSIQKNRFQNTISISPGGIKGFYYLGTLYYIKKHYDIQHYNYLGASAGSWNSLFMCYKGDDDKIINDIFNLNYKQSLAKAANMIKDNFLTNYNAEDFDLNKLSIGVTQLGKYNKLNLQYTIYDTFNDLEDALDCCIASSHVPFLIGGGILKKYKKKLTFDGGLKEISYKQPSSSILHVSSKLWNNEKYIKMPGLRKLKNFDPKIFFDDGYKDAEINSNVLDSIFTKL